MSPEFRKAALIAATLGLLVSLFFALSPDGDEPATGTQAERSTTRPEPSAEPLPSTTATATEPTETGRTPTATAPDPAGPVTLTISVASDAVPEVRRFSVRRGRVVEIVVRAELSDRVHLHGYDLIADVGPGRPARIRFTADAAGRFEVELEERHVRIAELEVTP